VVGGGGGEKQRTGSGGNVYVYARVFASIRWWPCADAGGADLAAVDEWMRVYTDVGVRRRE